MSQSLQEIFKKLVKNHPPVEHREDAKLKLTSKQIHDMIFELDDQAFTATDSVYGLMKENGYFFDAIDYDDRIEFVWLLG